MEILKKIEEVLQVVFEDETLIVDEKTSANDVEGWDSMHHIVILSMLEEKFGINFEIDEIISIQCVGDMCDIIRNKTEK